MGRKTYGKSASTYRKPSGLYVATVTRVDGVNVFVAVPRLTLDFEHGPIPYSGPIPEVGSEVFVGFLEGIPDDVVAIFPGGGGGGGGGPIEPTFFVSSSTERDELKAVADFVDGVDVHAIATACDSIPAGGGKVQLGAGVYDLAADGFSVGAAYLNVGQNTMIHGVGDATVLRVPLEYRRTAGWENGQISLGAGCVIKDLKVKIYYEDQLNVGKSNACVFEASGGAMFDNVTFDGMAAAMNNASPPMGAELGYSYVEGAGVKALNCRILDLPPWSQ